MSQIINYNKIYEEYNHNLLNKLRGFGDNENDEYLKYWVPSENFSKSLINLLISLKDQKYQDFRIELDLSNLNDEDRIIDFILEKEFKSLKIKKNNMLVTLDFKNFNKNDLENINSHLLNKKVKVQNNNINVFEENKNINFDNKLKSVEEDENYIKQSEKKLVFFIKNLKDLKIKNTSGSLEIEDKIDDVNYYFRINKINLSIEECFFSQKEINSLTKYLDIFFSKIKGLNLQEARDHGILKVDEEILKNDNISGIRLPQFLFIEYSIMKKIINKVYLKSQLKFENVNKCYRETSVKWKSYNKEERKKIAAQKIEEFKKLMNLDFKFEILQFEDIYRIVLNLDKINNKNISKAKIFFDLENFLKKNLEYTLEIFSSEIIDQNKLRLKNSPQL